MLTKWRKLLTTVPLLDRRLARVRAGDGEAILQLTLLWEPRDLWVGAYWDRKIVPFMYQRQREFGGWVPFWGVCQVTEVYLCLVWCLPLRFVWTQYGERLWWKA